MDNDLSQRLAGIEFVMKQLNAKLDTLLAKKKTKPMSSKAKYPVEFENVWATYPHRIGANPKKKAFSAWMARLRELIGSSREDKHDIYHGAARYAKFCDATIEDKRFVMQAATFFGPDKHYENDWTIPTQKETLPRDNNKLVSWAQDKGFRPPNTGEEYPQYRIALERLIRSE